MPTVWEIAEALAALYWQLCERRHPSLETALGALCGAMADLDTLAGEITRPAVRRMLDGSTG